jgi:hypothetical protein
MRFITLGVVLLSFILLGSAASADIYTWTDAKGIKHYSDRPPENVTNARVVFPEYQHDEAADQMRFEMEQEEWNTLINAIEAEDQKDKEAKRKRAEEAQKNRALTQQELVAAEQQRLEQKIAELEEQPLEFFGSQKNKRVRIGYYHYRLEALLQDPDEYFKNPQGFEGNVKNPPETGN